MDSKGFARRQNMAKEPGQKLRILRLADIFREYTDETHGLSRARIEEMLREYNISVERKTFYEDIKLLCDYGMEILSYIEKHTHYYYLSTRKFELPELKLLVDSVQSARFITEKKSSELIRKLETLTSIHNARQLHRQVIISGRVKTVNERIFYNVDDIHTAVGRNAQITFRYCQWSVSKTLEPRRGGSLYQVSPWELVWDDENYYLVAFDSKAADFRHFRVDKMTDISVTDLPRDGREYYDKIDMAHYRSAHFGMFSGEEVSVALLCRNELIGVIIDRFGTDIPIIPKDSGYFTTHINVVVSQQFIGWLVGIGEGITVLSPDSVVQRLQAEAERLKRLYPQDIPM